MKHPAVYITTNKRNGTIYTGITSNLVQRIYQHKHAIIKGFSSKHMCKLLVYYQFYETMESAIAEEKRIKGGSRKKKLQLIEKTNSEWKDLYNDII